LGTDAAYIVANAVAKCFAGSTLYLVAVFEASTAIAIAVTVAVVIAVLIAAVAAIVSSEAIDMWGYGDCGSVLVCLQSVDEVHFVEFGRELVPCRSIRCQTAKVGGCDQVVFRVLLSLLKNFSCNLKVREVLGGAEACCKEGLELCKVLIGRCGCCPWWSPGWEKVLEVAALSAHDGVQCGVAILFGCIRVEDGAK
jgi:hypothetical protein